MPEKTTPEGATPEDTTPEDTTPEDTTPEDTTPEDTTPEDTTRASSAEISQPDSVANRRRTWRSLVRPGRGQLIAAVILFVVGLGGVMQVKSNQADEGFSTARRTDLVQLLDGLSDESRRLENETADLQRTRSTLQSGADSQRVAREEAQQRIDALGVLAGTVPAQGPGIRLTIDDPTRKLTAEQLLDGVEELRDAGAEVIEINGKVRVVASSWFGSDADGLVVDGKTLTQPITVTAIGDPHSLSAGITFRGGFADKIKADAGAEVAIESVPSLTVTSLHSPPQNQYARPSSSRTPGG